MPVKRISAVFTLLATILLFSQPAAALNARVTVEGPNGPVSGIAVDAGGFITITDQSGIARFFGVAPGVALNFTVDPFRSPFECSQCGALTTITGSFTPVNSGPNYDQPSDTFNAGSINVPLAATRITVNVNGKTSGNPAPNVQVSLFSPDDRDFHRHGRTDSTGRVVLGAVAGKALHLSAHSPSGDFGEVFQDIAALIADENRNVNLSPVETDATINITLIKTDGSAFSLPSGGSGPGGFFADAFCSPKTPTPGSHFRQSFFNFQPPPAQPEFTNEAAVRVAGGTTYVCSGHIGGPSGGSSVGITRTEVTLGAGETKDIVITAIEKDYTIRVRFLKDGASTTPEGVVVTAFPLPGQDGSPSEGGVFGEDRVADNGVYEVRVVKGSKYGIGFFKDAGPGPRSACAIRIADTGEEIVVSNPFQEVNASDPSGVSAVDFKVLATNATITVTVRRDGQTIPAHVDAFEPFEEIIGPDGRRERNEGLHLFKFAPQGTATFSVPAAVGGTDLEVIAWPMTDGFPGPNSPITHPVPKRVTILPGTNQTLELNIVRPDFDLLAILEAPVQLDFAFCAAHSEQGATHTQIIRPNQGASVAASGVLGLIKSAGQYQIFCEGGTIPLDSEPGEIYRAEFDYTIPAGSASDSRAITLERDTEPFYRPASITFDPTESQSFNFPAGKLEIPANSIEVDSGDVTLTLGSSNSARPRNDSLKLRGVVALEIRDQSGVEITELSLPITLTLYPPPGVDADALTCSGTNEVDTGFEDVRCEKGADGSFIFTLNHLSDYGFNAARANGSGAPDAPASVRVKASKSKAKGSASKKKQKKSYLVTWSAVSGAKKYEVRTTFTDTAGNPTQSSKRIAASKRQLAVTPKKPGTYQYSVAALSKTGKKSAFRMAQKEIVLRGKTKKKS